MLRDTGMEHSCEFDGCAYGLVSAAGVMLQKPWRVCTAVRRLVQPLSQKCHHALASLREWLCHQCQWYQSQWRQPCWWRLLRRISASRALPKGARRAHLPQGGSHGRPPL